MSGQNLHESFTLDRLYPKLRPEVWAAWSVCEKKAAWLHYPGLEMDFRVGGLERCAIRIGPDVHTAEGRYFEISASERIVLAYSMALNGRVHTISLATVTFADEGEWTRLTYTEQLCIIQPSDGRVGREHGWSFLLGCLADFLEPGDEGPNFRTH